MTTGIEAMTTASLSLALDAASLRHQAIAANIANIKTQGYVPQRVNFEAQLASAQHSLHEQGSIAPQDLIGVGAHLESALNAAGQPVVLQLDGLVAQMAQNAVQYQALVKGLTRHMSLLMSAASDGKK